MNDHDVKGWLFEIRKMPRKTRISERQQTWRKSSQGRLTCVLPFGNEYAAATPTMNMNDGWMRSQKEQPTH